MTITINQRGRPSTEVRLRLLRSTLLIRAFEQRAADLFAAGHIPGFIHTYLGQEGIAAGACAALRDDDYVTSTHRGHGHCLAKGADPGRMMAELLGRSTGYCKGKGGSMHIAAADRGILGANGIVAGGLPIAVGAAYSARVRGTSQVAVAFFGDGAVNQGAFHEALNLAAVQDLPVIFVCENNGYAEMTPQSVHTRLVHLADRAAAYPMVGIQVMGNDAEEVFGVVTDAVARARAGQGPTFIEARTYRWHGHYEGDSAAYRPAGELETWRASDPCLMLRQRLIEQRVVTSEDLALLDEEIERAINAAVAFADQSPWPDPTDLREDVWASGH